MYLLNCIAANNDIKKILNKEANEPDDLKYGFEFGTWGFSSYFTFFETIANIPKTKDLHNHTFTKKERTKIYDALTKIVKRFKKSKSIIFPTDKVKELIFRNNPKDYRIVDTRLNNYSDYTKELIELKHNNPLRLCDNKYYKKLALIFNQKKVQIISL